MDNEVKIAIQTKNEVIETIIGLHYDELKEFLEKYVIVLARKYSQLIYKDEYGDWVFTDWFNERNNFANTKMLLIKNKLSQEAQVLHSKLNKISWDTWDTDYDMIMMGEIVEKFVFEYLENSSDVEKDSTNDIESHEDILNDPILFEKYVASLFESHGWNISLTKRTGDQGADIVARNESGVTIIVQCKLYSQPVGNKAVQEVFSAKSHYKGHVGMVITNSTYTKSARQLAESCDVYLLHYEGLSQILDSLSE